MLNRTCTVLHNLHLSDLLSAAKGFTKSSVIQNLMLMVTHLNSVLCSRNCYGTEHSHVTVTVTSYLQPAQFAHLRLE